MKTKLSRKDYLKFKRGFLEVFNKKDIKEGDREWLCEAVGDINWKIFNNEYSDRELDVFEQLLWYEYKKKSSKRRSR